MAALDGKKTVKNLIKKGFIQSEGDHHWFEYWKDGKMISRTKTSHNSEEIHEGLISAMSKQCKVSKTFFTAFAKCTKTEADYVSELQNNGTISNPDENRAA